VGSQIDAEHIDKLVESTGAKYCQGGTMSPREKYLKAYNDLQTGATTKKMDPAQCRALAATMRSLMPIVKPDQDNDTMIKFSPKFVRSSLVGCLARAGDCAGARDTWQKEPDLNQLPGMPPLPDAVLRAHFDSTTQNKCKGQ